MYQRVSLSCVLSTLSPVAIASAGALPSIGLRSRRTCCADSSITNGSKPLLRAVAGVERAAVAVDELDARRRLLVDELEVRQLDEGEEEAATRLPACLRRGELGAHEPLLAGPGSSRPSRFRSTIVPESVVAGGGAAPAASAARPAARQAAIRVRERTSGRVRERKPNAKELRWRSVDRRTCWRDWRTRGRRR